MRTTKPRTTARGSLLPILLHDPPQTLPDPRGRPALTRYSMRPRNFRRILLSTTWP